MSSEILRSILSVTKSPGGGLGYLTIHGSGDLETMFVGDSCAHRQWIGMTRCVSTFCTPGWLFLS